MPDPGQSKDPGSLSSIIIIGSGAFGLSTALWLASRRRYTSTRITVIDKSPFPACDGSSVDSSRIIRADYSDPTYAALAAKAREIWNETSRNLPGLEQSAGGELTPAELFAGVGADGRYLESGLVLVATPEAEGFQYVKASYANVKRVFDEGDLGILEWLQDEQAIGKVLRTGGCGGDGAIGYINRNSGWANAQEAMVWTRQRCEAFPNLRFITAEVESLLLDEADEVKGVKLSGGEELEADLTIVATGAWTPRLIDMTGRAVATGQVIAYLKLSEDEERRYRDMPICLNLHNGVFVIPPRNGLLKVARHSYGYVNSTTILRNGKHTHVSLPLDEAGQRQRGLWVPPDAVADLRQGLKDMVPGVADREFVDTRICWYTDTPKGDFIVAYHPNLKNLFVATGGSGHGFKFLPVLGSKITEVLEGTAEASLQEKWKWQNALQSEIVTEDGSRSGTKRVDLKDLLGQIQSKI